MVQDLTPGKSPSQKVKLWLLRVRPFFHTILHQDIINFVVLEQGTGGFHHLPHIFGAHATRLKHIFFELVIHVIDYWIELSSTYPATSSLEALSLSCGVINGKGY